jgi:dihydroflavonol-4-reductase
LGATAAAAHVGKHGIMNVFVTGATGFIGRHLMQLLAQTDHRVSCLVRRTSDIGRLEALGAVPVMGDLRDKGSLLKGMEGCDWVLNVAARISFWERDGRIYTDVNFHGTRNIMEAVLETGVAKVVHVSAAGVLGKSGSRPVTEEGLTDLPEVNDYIRSKAAGERIAWELCREKALPIVVVYPVGVTGAGDDRGLGPYVRNLVKRRMPFGAFGDSVLTFVHVRDVAEAILRAAEKEGNIGERYVIGKHRLSMHELDEMICSIAGVRVPAMRLPDRLVAGAAALLTVLADVTRRPPPMGLSTASVRMIRGGFVFDGSKAEQELGISYTPIRAALEELVRSVRTANHP